MAERIEIIFIERGLNRIVRDINDAGRAARGTESAMQKLRDALVGLGAGITLGRIVRGLVEMVDAYTNIQNRLKSVTAGTDELKVVTDELFGISQRTRQSFEHTAEVYARAAASVKVLGTSQAETLRFTESLNQAVVLSGAGAAEAKGSLIQLAQAMSSNRLSGDEMRSVLEQLPVVADVIAKRLGVTRGEIKSLGQQGKITAKVILEAFQQARAELAERFAKTVPTISQSFQRLSDSVLRYIGVADQASGTSASIAGAIIFLADHIDILAKSFIALAVAASLFYGPAAVGAALGGIGRILGFLALNPFVALGIALVAVAGYVVAFRKELMLTEDSVITVSDLFTAMGVKIGIIFDQLIDKTRRLINFWARLLDLGQLGAFKLTWEDVFRAIARGLDQTFAFWATYLGTIKDGIKFLGLGFAEMWVNVSNAMVDVFNKALRGINTITNKIREFTGQDAQAATQIGKTENNFSGSQQALIDTLTPAVIKQRFLENFSDMRFLEPFLDDSIKMADQIAKERILREGEERTRLANARAALEKGGPDLSKPVVKKSRKITFDELIGNLRKEGAALLLVERARERAMGVIKIEERLRRSLTKTEREEAELVIHNNQLYKERAEVVDALLGPEQEFLVKTVALNNLLAETPGRANQVNRALAEVELAFLKAQGVTTGPGSNFAENYVRQLRIMQLETRDMFGELEAGFAQIVGPGGTLVQGIGDATAHWLVMGESAREVIHQLSAQILSQIVSSLVQVGINMAINAALGSALSQAATAQTVAQAGTTAAAWAPAAAAASLATAGSNVTPALIGIGAVLAAAVTAFALTKGFKSGGFTGNMSPSKVSGVVHGQEFVMNAAATRRNRAQLEAMNNGGGGRMGGVTIYNNSPAHVSAEDDGRGGIRVMIQEELRQHAPRIIANDMAASNSPTSKALKRHVKAGRNTQ